MIAICSEKRNEKKEKWIFRCSKLNEAKVVVKKCKTDFRLDCGESDGRTDCGLSKEEILQHVKVRKNIGKMKTKWKGRFFSKKI